MPTQTFHMPRRWLLHPLVAAIAAGASWGAWADEPNPYYLGVSQAYAHDSNVYRTPNGSGDSYWTTSLLGGFDQSIGRQHFVANARVGYNKYQEQTTLDNTSYGVSAGWDWSTIEKLSGSVSVDASQSLASFDNSAIIPLTTRNILKTEQLATSVRWGGDGIVTVQGSYSHSRAHYSAPEYITSQSTGDAVSLGVYYRLSADIKLGSALRYSRTEQPYAIATVPGSLDPSTYLPNKANGHNLDLTADWRATGQTFVNARLSWTRTSNSSAGGLDFSGLTGAVSASYAPTAKLGFTASISRDSGTNSSFFNIPTTTAGAPITGLTQNSQTTDTLALGATYEVTAKINLNTGVQYRRSKLVDTFVVGGGSSSTDGHDNSRLATFGANYAIARNWQLACNLAHSSRSVSGTLNYSYSANTIGCSAQFTLR